MTSPYLPYDVAPTGTVAGDKAAVIAAAATARDAGEMTVRLADGDWRLDGLTPTDIYDRYLIMERGTITPASYVYPFKPHEWAGRSARQGNYNGSGRIAIEVDDAALAQWTTLFPLTKQLGIPLSLSWHTGFSNSGWVHEAYRHGWELMSHLPDNYRAPDLLAAGTLEAMAQESLDAIHAITGPNVPIGFVYPAHVRTPETDRVLSKYYDRGRGVAGPVVYSRDMPAGWLTTAYGLDPHFAGGVISESAKRILRRVAAADGQMVFYMHWITGDEPTKGPALAQFVRYAQSLGIEFVTSGQIWGDRNMVEDPYFERSGWMSTGGATISTGAAYHRDKSASFVAPGPGNLIANVYEQERAFIPSKPGMFTKVRVSFRTKNDAEVKFSTASQGVRPMGTLGYRVRSGESTRTTGLVPLTGINSPSGSIPPGDWVQHHHDVYLHPSVMEAGFGVGLANMLPGGDLRIDEVRAVPAGHVAEYVTTAKLLGTGNLFVYTPVMDLFTKCRIKIEPATSMAGELSVSANGNSGLLIKSSSAADTMDIRISVTPRGVWYDDE